MRRVRRRSPTARPSFATQHRQSRKYICLVVATVALLISIAFVFEISEFGRLWHRRSESTVSGKHNDASSAKLLTGTSKSQERSDLATRDSDEVPDYAFPESDHKSEEYSNDKTDDASAGIGQDSATDNEQNSDTAIDSQKEVAQSEEESDTMQESDSRKEEAVETESDTQSEIDKTADNQIEKTTDGSNADASERTGDDSVATVDNGNAAMTQPLDDSHGHSQFDSEKDDVIDGNSEVKQFTENSGFFGNLSGNSQMVAPWLCPSLHSEYPSVTALWQRIGRQQMGACSEASPSKVMILDNPCERMGLFATLLCWAYYSQMAFRLQQRAVVLSGEWATFESTDEHCLHSHAPFACHFLPFSNCANAHEAFNHLNAANDEATDFPFDEFRLLYYLASVPQSDISDGGYYPWHRQMYDAMKHCVDANGNGTVNVGNATDGGCAKFSFLDVFQEIALSRVPSEKLEALQRNAEIRRRTGKSELCIISLREYQKKGWAQMGSETADCRVVWVKKLQGVYHSMDTQNWHNDMDSWVSETFAEDLSWGQYTSLWYLLFLRPRPWLRQKLEADMAFLNGRYQLSQLNASESIAVPIRWGDKCANNPRAKEVGNPEMYCFTVTHMLDVVVLLKLSALPHLKNVIVTSDSPSVIEEVVSSWKTLAALSQMRLIVNERDVMQENGIMAAGKSSESDPQTVMQSMLTTVRLQLVAKYVTFYWRSSWARSIWYLSQVAQCAPHSGGRLATRSVGIQLQPPRPKAADAAVDQLPFVVHFEKQMALEVLRWKQRLDPAFKGHSFRFRSIHVAVTGNVPWFGI